MKTFKEKLRSTLAKENFIIKQHHECHNANRNGDCKDCNREDTLKELEAVFKAEIDKLKGDIEGLKTEKVKQKNMETRLKNYAIEDINATVDVILNLINNKYGE